MKRFLFLAALVAFAALLYFGGDAPQEGPAAGENRPAKQLLSGKKSQAPPEPARSEESVPGPVGRNDVADRLALVGIAIHGDRVPCNGGLAAAWLPWFEPTLEDFREAAIETPRSTSVWMSEIGEDGTFSIPVPPGSYRVGAVSPGAVSRPSQTTYAPDSDRIELAMDHLYGIVIAVQDSRGIAIETSESLFGEGPSIKGHGARSLKKIPTLLDLLGIDGLDLTGQSRDRWTYLLTSEVRVAGVGPMDYSIQVPGYEPLTAQVTAYPVVDRIAEVTLNAHAIASGWGTLVVRSLASEGSLSVAMPPQDNVASVFLVDESFAVTSFAVSLAGLASGEVVSGIPAGRYSAFLEAKEGYFRTPDVPIEVTAGEQTLEFDLHEAGALQVEVFKGDDVYSGSLITSVVDPEGAVFHTNWDRAPYCLPLLTGGEYRLKAVLVAGSAVELPREPRFTVVSGQMGSLRLSH